MSAVTWLLWKHENIAPLGRSDAPHFCSVWIASQESGGTDHLAQSVLSHTYISAALLRMEKCNEVNKNSTKKNTL